jgi:hypothetical protein
MKERAMMLEDLIEQLEILDEIIWEAQQKIDEIYADDFHYGSMLAKVSARIEEARGENELALSEVRMELDQYE